MNQNTASDDDDDHRLPWLATGRLGAAETTSLQARLRNDADLRRRLAIAQEEQAATTALNEALGAPSPAARTALFARIDASARRTPDSLLERLGAWLMDFSPRTVALGALGAVTLTLLQAGLVSGLLLPRADPTYNTAAAPPVSDGDVVLIGFTPQASAAAITALLHELQASIVGGPHPGDLFDVRISDGRLSRPALDAVMARLRRETDTVRLVTGATASGN